MSEEFGGGIERRVAMRVEPDGTGRDKTRRDGTGQDRTGSDRIGSELTMCV